MKCLNLAFNAQRLRVIMLVVQVGAVKIYAAIVRRSGKRKEGMKLSLPPNFILFSTSKNLNNMITTNKFEGI